VNDAGRTVLAALGLCAAALAAEKGFDLRSRCLLWPSEPMTWELLAKPGETPKRVSLDADAAIALLTDAVKSAERVGLKWRSEPLILKPAPQLLELVRKSQTLAGAQGGDAEGGD
jgi:CRISPR-associated protein Csb1